MSLTIMCYHCNMKLYTTKKIKFPLDYSSFVPIHDGIDTVIPDDPVCPFCERAFQVVSHDISWSKMPMAPILTNRGVFNPKEKASKPHAISEPKDELGVGPYCACGCGNEVKNEGDFVSNLHRLKMVAAARA